MTKDDIIKLAREAGLFVHKEVQPEFLAFADLVAAAQKEADAKLIEEYPYWLGTVAKQEIAAAIRARGIGHDMALPDPATPSRASRQAAF